MPSMTSLSEKPVEKLSPKEAASELQMARPATPQPKIIRMPDKFPEQPWKKKS